MNNIPHGSFRAWYPNNMRMGVGEYRKGKASGVWTIWDQKGNVLISADIGEVKSGKFRRRKKLSFVRAR